MTKHTDLPWTVSEVRTTEGTAMIVAGNGPDFGLVADVTEDYDAAFIVKAVNNFDAMVAALAEAKSALRSCYQVADYPANGQSDQDIALAMVEGALAAVSGAGDGK